MQLDDIPMGGSISPALANVFLCHHEEDWINNCSPEFKPIFYPQYVDDTFVLFKNPSQIKVLTLILTCLKTLNPYGGGPYGLPPLLFSAYKARS